MWRDLQRLQPVPTVAVLATILSTTSCMLPLEPSQETAEALETERVEASEPSLPILIAPGHQEIIPQNELPLGCPSNPTAGSGFRIAFNWSDVTIPGGESQYRLHVQHEGAIYPLVDRLVVGSAFTYVGCGFVIDSNLSDWKWKVRIEDPRNLGEWTESRSFQLAPCRLADGTRCRSEPRPS